MVWGVCAFLSQTLLDFDYGLTELMPKYKSQNQGSVWFPSPALPLQQGKHTAIVIGPHPDPRL